MMCKHFAHGYTCTWMKRFGNCKMVHSDEVKAAHDYVKKHRQDDKLPIAEEIKFLLSRKCKLNEIQTKVNQRLLNIYPPELSMIELKRVKEDEMKDQMNDAFMKMYDLSEEDMANQQENTK